MIDNTTTLKIMVIDNISTAWILKDRVVVVDDFCHAQQSFEILKDLIFISENHMNKLYEKETHLEFTNKYSMYRIMYRMGFIRVSVYTIDGIERIIMEQADSYIPNEYQQRLLNKADQVDKVNIYYVKGHENDN